MTEFRDRTYKQITEVKQSHKHRALTQQDWCLCKKRHPQAGSILHMGTEKSGEHREREQSANQEETPLPEPDDAGTLNPNYQVSEL